MTSMYFKAATETDLSRKLVELDITLSFIHLGFNTCKSFPDADDWSVTLQYNGKKFTTEYHTGVGHRILKPSVVKEGKGYYNKFQSLKAYNDLEAVEKGYIILPKNKGKLIGPNMADVIHCLLADSSCANESFDSWCGALGYNTDSRKALDTYLQCQETRLSMVKLLGSGLFDVLVGLEH